MVLVHGAWHRGSSWEPVAGDLERAGIPVSAPDLPDTRGAGHAEQVAAVLAAAGPDGAHSAEAAEAGSGSGDAVEPVVLVGHSLGGLVAPVVADRLGPARVRALVLVGALVPEPGRAYRDRLRAERDLMVAGYDAGVLRGEGPVTYWPDAETVAAGLYRGVADELHELAGATEPSVPPAGGASPGGAGSVETVPGPDAVVAAAAAEMRPQDWTLLAEPCPLTAWPRVRTLSVVCTGDRVVDPVAGRREAARIGAEVVELPGGHFPMLTRTGELTALLAGLATGATAAAAGT